MTVSVGTWFSDVMSRMRKRRAHPKPPTALSGRDTLDVQLDRLVADVNDSADPIGMLNMRIDNELADLTSALSSHRPERVVELARVSCLPWMFEGVVKPDTDGGPTKTELLTLLALTASTGQEPGSSRNEVMNGLYREAHDWAEAAASVIRMSQALQALQSQDDALARIAASVHRREVWIRNSSYPDMVKHTHDLLFDSHEVTHLLRGTVGFDAEDAARVLTALSQAQSNATNNRWVALGETAHSRPALLADVGLLGLTSEERVAFNRFWQPTADLVAFTAAEVDKLAGCGLDVTGSVLKHFSVIRDGSTPRQLLDRFVTGDNPLRTNPILRTIDDRFILIHDGLIRPAIRENLEQTMRGTTVWETYQSRRGTVLEEIGRAAFERLLPGTVTHFAFDYFVPGTDAEANLPPAKYTKRVEGDMLFVLDDVAVIVEAKAVAITPAARAGETRGLRRNLTDLITKAADQASRMQQRLAEDGGLRLKDGTWLDLSHVREVHTVALTLEDLTQVATATTALVEAGLLNEDRVPWVVSIHDLQLIAELIDKPADFLLYLRRRRDPEMPTYYHAIDELDLFLYYLDAGLYVAPDPVAMAAELPYASAIDDEDTRRRAEQQTVFVGVRTAPLDAWHQAQIDPTAPPAPKPHRTARPMDKLVGELTARRDYGWLSIGATLLAGDTDTQKGWARVPRMLLSNRRRDGNGRSYFSDAGNTRADAWALIWVTRPPRTPLEDIIDKATTYLEDKKYQIEVPRGVVFVFDERTARLAHVIYDGESLARSPEMDARASRLKPF